MSMGMSFDYNYSQRSRIRSVQGVQVQVQVRCPTCDLEWDLEVGNTRCPKGHEYPEAEKTLKDAEAKQGS